MVLSVELGVSESGREIPVQDVLDGVHVGLEVRGVGVALQEGVRDCLGDLRLAAAGHCAALVQGRRFAVRTLEVPLVVGLVVDHLHAVAVGRDVLGVGAHRDRLCAVIPGDGAVAQAELGSAGYQQDVVDAEDLRVTLVEHLEIVRVFGNDVGNRPLAGRGGVLLALVVGTVGAGTTGVLLLGQSEEVRGVGDLGLDLLLAVAEVVVGDNGEDDSGLVTGAQLERLALVVELRLVGPAHAVATLAVGGLVDVRQTEVDLADEIEVRGQDDAAAVAGPSRGLQSGVVGGQQRVPGIAENTFDEVEVGDQTAGSEEAGLHATFGDEARDPRHHEGTQQQGHPGVGLTLNRLGGRVRKQGVLRRGLEGEVKETGEDVDRDGLLVVGDSQTALRDMEDAGGGATIVARVVEHAVGDPVTRDQVGGELVTVDGEGKGSGQAGLIESQGGFGQVGMDGGVLAEVTVDECLDASVSRAEELRDLPSEFPLTSKYRGDDVDVGGARGCRQWQAVERQSEVHGVGVSLGGHESIVP